MRAWFIGFGAVIVVLAVVVMLPVINRTSRPPSEMEFVIPARVDLPEPSDLMPFSEMSDTAVREEIYIAVHCAVVERAPIPSRYQMFSDAGDLHVRSHVADRVETELDRLPPGATRQERIESLYGDHWRDEGSFDSSMCHNRDEPDVGQDNDGEHEVSEDLVFIRP